MASIVVAGDTSGTVTLTAPLVAGTTTLTLPTVNGTVLTSASSIPTSQLTGSVTRSQLPTGTVLQVVSASKTDAQSYAPAGNTWVDITGLSVSITPTSATSRILVFHSVNAGNGADGGHLSVRTVRDSTPIGIANASGSRPRSSSIAINTSIGGQQLTACNMFLDSPATTSALTYKIQGLVNAAGGTAFVNYTSRNTDQPGYDGLGVSNITVMEIAA